MSIAARRMVRGYKAAGQGGWTPSFPGEPRPGTIYYGISSSTGSPTSRESQLGQTMSLFRSYGTAGSTVDDQLSQISNTLAKNRLPIHSSKPPAPISWQAVANGTHDDWIQQMTDGMKALNKPIWWCIHHEPYDDTNGTTCTTTTFKRMYDHIYEWTNGSNIVLMPIMQSAPFSPSVGGDPSKILSWIPDSCDIIGMDSYNHWYPGGKNKWREPDVCLGDALSAVISYGKKTAICEYGVRTDTSIPGRSAQWMRDAKDYLVSQGCIAMSYFDSDRNVNDANPDSLPPPPWDLNHGGTVANQILETPADGYVGGPERLNAFATLLADSRTARLS